MTCLTTAAELLAAVRPFGPAVEGGQLVFDLDPPDHLVPTLEVLHTGVRAVLTGGRWWGSAADGRSPAVFPLDPDVAVPDRTGLLCVEGDATWDRVHPDARIDLPALFAPAVARRKTG